jgi:transcriptional regulator with XRE-family HTH domain
MSGIERGVRNVSILNLAKIARALSVPLTDLFQRD